MANDLVDARTAAVKKASKGLEGGWERLTSGVKFWSELDEKCERARRGTNQERRGLQTLHIITWREKQLQIGNRHNALLLQTINRAYSHLITVYIANGIFIYGRASRQGG